MGRLPSQSEGCTHTAVCPCCGVLRVILARSEKTCWAQNAFETTRVPSATDEIGTAERGYETRAPPQALWGFYLLMHHSKATLQVEDRGLFVWGEL
jgi:hypothetical protein